jgi:hypothetical protein
MVQSIRFRGGDGDLAQLQRDAMAAGFGDNVSAYMRHKLGLPPVKRGRPWPEKPAAKKVASKVKPKPPKPLAPTRRRPRKDAGR